jgi:hypothetical protein
MADEDEDGDGFDRDLYADDEGRFGCAFPGACCMPGEHMTDECHTAEMVEEWREAGHRERFEAWAAERGLSLELTTDAEAGPYKFGATALAWSAWRAALDSRTT